MQKIIPHLWFDNQAEEAVNFYTSIFRNSKVLNTARYNKPGAEVSGMPEGSVMNILFQLEGQEFFALNGGPYFTFTPAISFFVNCETQEELDAMWKKLSEGGMVLMELDKYPFSPRFGWVQDKFGVSWQLNLESRKQKITTFLMFVGKQHEKAEEAMNFYTSLFHDSNIKKLERYGAGEGDSEGAVKHAVFTLNGQEFMAIDSGFEHPFTFSEAISLFVNCETQEEIDRLWERLAEGGEIQECGWLIDRYGVTWQIVPAVLDELINDPDPVKSLRVAKAMFQMKKFDIAKLWQAYEGV